MLPCLPVLSAREPVHQHDRTCDGDGAAHENQRVFHHSPPETTSPNTTNMNQSSRPTASHHHETGRSARNCPSTNPAKLRFARSRSVSLNSIAAAASIVPSSSRRGCKDASRGEFSKNSRIEGDD